MRRRLDVEMVSRKFVENRSQAENYIRLNLVKINGHTVSKPGYMVDDADTVVLEGEQYVSRAALKLASIARQFDLHFKDTVVLDVGSSTGGFTDYALQHGAKKVVAVDVGTNQMHPKLRMDPRVELHEKTDIRDLGSWSLDLKKEDNKVYIKDAINIVVMDVSFISLRYILPAVSRLITLSPKIQAPGPSATIVAMCKPQFEAGKDQVNKGVIKNSAIRRQTLKDFESWLIQNGFMILDKADSQIAGTKGNVERFYKLKVRS